MLVTTMSGLYHTGVVLQNELVLASYQGRICDHPPSVLQTGDHVPFYSTANGSRKRVPEMCAPSEPVLVASGANSLRLGAERSL